MKKLLFLMNPCAGVRRANRFLPEILSVFNRAGYEVTAYMTAGPGDGIQAVASRAKELDRVVCCGGDGTFNETVSGLLQAGVSVPIGYIPTGSTNDFAASLGLPTDVLEAARLCVEGVPKPYDVGRFGDRYFSYVASFGAFTRTSYATPQSVKNALGHTAYLLEGIQELSQIHPEHVYLELDQESVEGDFLFGAISNALRVGGVLNLDPKQVDMGDGKFEILLIRAPTERGELAACIQALQKQTYNCAMITFRSARQMRIFARPDMDWTLDGEWAQGQGQIEVVNLHHAMEVIQREEEKG